MSYTLAEFRDMARRSILNDPNGTKWQDAAVRDYICWALDTFCAHTAMAATLSIADGDLVDEAIPDGDTWDLSTATSFPLPSDIYGNETEIETSIRVTIRRSDGRVVFKDPLHYSPGMDPSRSDGFHIWPGDTLVLGTAPGTGATLNFDYFAYYPHPTEEDDLILAPRWSTTALMYLIGANALTPFGMRSADIRQWAGEGDKGNPEDNSLRVQQQWLMDMYERELARYPNQDRANFYRGMN